MAGTRTASTVDGTPDKILVSIRLIDKKGDTASDVIVCPPTVTNAEIENYVAKYALATNASIYAVHVEYAYIGQKDAGNAATELRDMVSNVVNFLAKSDTDAYLSQRAHLRAPIDDMFQSESDNVVITATEFQDWYVAASALFNGGAGGSGDYSSRSVKYSDRKGANNVRQSF